MAKKEKKKALFQKKIDETRASLSALSDHADNGATGAIRPANLKQLRNMTSMPAHDLRTSLDGILNPIQPSATEEEQVAWNVPQQPANLPFLHSAPPSNSTLESGASQMFLRPAQLPKGEKVLRIIDFLDNIVPREDEGQFQTGATLS